MDGNGVQHKVRVMLQRRWLRVLLIFGCWTFLALFFASRMALSYGYSGSSIAWGFILKLSFIQWYGWAVLAPLVFLLARRFSFEGRWWWAHLLVHLPTGLFLAVVKFQMDSFLASLVITGRYRMRSANELHPNILTYWVLVGVVLGIVYYRRYRERELRASQLEARLAQARLEALKMQLHPHFLFNTLNGISALMHRDVEAADRMLVRLSDLLRMTLESGDAQETSLKQELEFLNAYLEIEKTRFGDRLTVDMQVDPETLDARVPTLILQPLVENAIRHGIAPQVEPGRIELRAQRRNGRLCLQVSDNGAGLPEGTGDALREGVGLSNTRARLAQLYGEDYRFELENGKGSANGREKGLRVTVEIPYRREEGVAE